MSSQVKPNDLFKFRIGTLAQDKEMVNRLYEYCTAAIEQGEDPHQVPEIDLYWPAGPDGALMLTSMLTKFAVGKYRLIFDRLISPIVSIFDSEGKTLSQLIVALTPYRDLFTLENASRPVKYPEVAKSLEFHSDLYRDCVRAVRAGVPSSIIPYIEIGGRPKADTQAAEQVQISVFHAGTEVYRDNSVLMPRKLTEGRSISEYLAYIHANFPELERGINVISSDESTKDQVRAVLLENGSPGQKAEVLEELMPGSNKMAHGLCAAYNDLTYPQAFGLMTEPEFGGVLRTLATNTITSGAGVDTPVTIYTNSRSTPVGTVVKLSRVKIHSDFGTDYEPSDDYDTTFTEWKLRDILDCTPPYHRLIPVAGIRGSAATPYSTSISSLPMQLNSDVEVKTPEQSVSQHTREVRLHNAKSMLTKALDILGLGEGDYVILDRAAEYLLGVGDHSELPSVVAMAVTRKALAFIHDFEYREVPFKFVHGEVPKHLVTNESGLRTISIEGLAVTNNTSLPESQQQAILLSGLFYRLQGGKGTVMSVADYEWIAEAVVGQTFPLNWNGPFSNPSTEAKAEHAQTLKELAERASGVKMRENFLGFLADFGNRA